MSIVATANFGRIDQPPRTLHSGWMDAIGSMPNRALKVESAGGAVNVAVCFSTEPFERGQIGYGSVALNVTPDEARYIAASLLREAELADGRGAIVSVEVCPAGRAPGVTI